MAFDAPSQPFTPIGITNWRNSERVFGIKPADRLQHIYCIGKTGVGKSTLLCKMAVDDIHKGSGIAVLDPHGDVAEKLVASVPEFRKNDIVYLNGPDSALRTGFNPLQNVPGEQRHIVASEVVLMFKRIWGDIGWGARMEYILRYCILTLLEYPTATLLDIQPLLLDASFRNLVLHYTDNAAILWHNEFSGYTSTMRAEAISPILNKAGVFHASATLRNIVGTTQSIDMDDIMNSGKILVCNLSKGLIGEDVSQMLGSLIATSLQTAAMRRAKLPAENRRHFYVYIDEMHSFVSGSFVTMLSEVRKYGVGLFLTHQYLEQLPEPLQRAVLGNVGTIVAFRLSAQDAKVMVEEFYPVFRQDDFVSLPRFHFYIRLLIDGMAGRAFSAQLH
jgi:type IV secretory pathway TraG/TraD family ATPase VirD4